MEIKLQLSRKPTGKVSQLPPDLIDYVNYAIQDGVKYDEIIRQLKERGYPGFNKNNLSRWRRSGHCQWLLLQERNDAMRIRCEASLTIAKDLGVDGQQDIDALNDRLVSLQIADTLRAFQDSPVDMNKNPENFFRIARLVTENSRQAIHQKKIALHAELLRRSLASDSSNAPTEHTDK